MSKIERRIKNDDDRHNHELEAILETEKLLTQYSEELLNIIKHFVIWVDVPVEDATH